jgi:hypothetical protein
MHAPHNRLSRRVVRSVAALIIAGTLAATAIHAGGLPNLLDDNRGNLALEATETAAFNLAISTAGFFADPLTFTYPPVLIEGRVLHHPKIHNLYLDDDWDGNNPDAPTRAQLDTFTRELVSSGYFDAAGQYGVGSGSFTGSHERSVLCAPLQPIAGHAEFVEILAWVTCEVGFNPLPVPGVFPALTGVPKADDDSLYVVYLPRSVTIADGGCDQLSAYHFFGAVPDIDIEIIVPVPRSQTFAFAVVPTACAGSSTPDQIRNRITRAASHEIIEAATDPIVATGWINNSIVTDSDDGFFSKLINSFSNISTDLKAGEAADICDENGTLLGAPAFQHPTKPIPILASDPSLGASFLVAPYWANQQNACAPFVPKSTLTLGTPSFASVFVTSATPIKINAVDGGSGKGVASIAFRFYPEGTTPPAFTTQAPPVSFSLSGSDGRYTVDMFATGNNGIVEVTHSSVVVLDNSAPVITIVQPTATEYPHSAVLKLDYSANDGTGSGVASTTASLDGSTALNGHGLPNGQSINLLTELALGPHSFSVQSVDHVGNDAIKSVSFTIVVTPESIKQDVDLFTAAGLIRDPSLPTALLAKLDSAAEARARGNCSQSASLYAAFISLLQAQSGKGVDPTAAAIMIADAQFLITHCP